MQTVEIQRTERLPIRPGGARILVVDDEPRIRLALRSCLEDVGYEVLEAADGMQALDRVISDAPDLMILDLAMPNLGGVGALESLSGVHGQLKPKVIVLTAWASVPAAMRTISLGASLFMPKPVLPQDLRAAVIRVLNEPNDAELGIPIDWDAPLRDEQ